MVLPLNPFEGNGLTTLMLQSTRNSCCTLCLVLLIMTLFTACSSSQNNSSTPSPSKNLITVSFQKSFDLFPPYSSVFEITDFHSSPGAVSSDSTYLYTTQKYCLNGKGVPQPEQTSAGSPTVSPRDTSIFCFSINDPIPYELYAPPIHTGVFPIAKFPPGKAFTHELNKLTLVRLDLKEYYGAAQFPRARTVILENVNASGTIEITASEKDRLAGTININDNNLSVTGTFDCPLR